MPYVTELWLEKKISITFARTRNMITFFEAQLPREWMGARLD